MKRRRFAKLLIAGAAGVACAKIPVGAMSPLRGEIIATDEGVFDVVDPLYSAFECTCSHKTALDALLVKGLVSASDNQAQRCVKEWSEQHDGEVIIPLGTRFLADTEGATSTEPVFMNNSYGSRYIAGHIIYAREGQYRKLK